MIPKYLLQMFQKTDDGWEKRGLGGRSELFRRGFSPSFSFSQIKSVRRLLGGSAGSCSPTVAGSQADVNHGRADERR